MALIRILGKEGLRSTFYVKNGAYSEKSSLIDPTHDKIAILATFSSKMVISRKKLKTKCSLHIWGANDP